MEFEVVRTEDDPAGEHEPDVEEEGADEEPEHVGGGPLHGQDEDVVGAEESKIAENAKPDQAISRPQHQAKM